MPKPQRAEDFHAPPRKTDLTQCIYCRQKWKVGDRIVQVFRVAGIGYDSQTAMTLPAAAEDYELAHGRCVDPQADGASLILRGGDL
jgi:hypothetical protein